MEEYKFDTSSCNNIEVPEKINSIISDSVVRAEEKERKRKKTIKYFSAVAASLVIFIFSVNMSPVLASSLSKIPGLEYLVNLVSFDKGLSKAIENNFVQHINKSAESRNIKFTIKDIIIDKKNMIIAYEIETRDKSYNDLNIYMGKDTFKIIDYENGNLMYSVQTNSYPDENFKNTGKKEGIISVAFYEMSEIPESVAVRVMGMEDGYYKGNTYKNHTIDGDWTIKFNIDSKLASRDPYYYPINKSIHIGNVNILMKDFIVYPTCGEIKLDLSNNKDYKFIGFVNGRLVDEKGLEYKMRGGRGSVDDSEKTLICESSYFTQAKTLSFKADGALFIPKKDMYITVDIKNKKIIDNCGLDMELMYSEFQNAGDEKTYNVVFKIKDKEILKMNSLPGNGFGALAFSEITDEKNHKYEKFGMQYSSGEKDLKTGEEFIRSGVSLYNVKTLPEILKLKVSYASKGLLKPVNIKIK